MNTLLTAASSVALSVLLLATRAQTPATTHDSPSPTKTATKTTDRRAAAYKGPKVVKDTKALGTKMLRNSKPTNVNPVLRPVPLLKQ